jgi:hypothetical protein
MAPILHFESAEGVMKGLLLTALAACAVAIASLTAELSAVSAAESVKLIGCLVGGEDDDDGYLLTNPMGDIASRRVAAGAVTPGPVGTTGGSTLLFYWLEDDDQLEPHLGHMIEVDGELKGDVKQGEIELERADKWTELTIESDGRALTARVPQSLFVVSTRSSDDRAIDVQVRKVDAKSVRMLSAMCE